MTREEAKRLSNILKAYSEGKIIQYQENGKHRYSDLRFYDFPDQDNISLETQEYNYRIKPEPKYRPFKTQEECWNEMLKHQPFGWIKGNTTGEYKQIVRIYNYKSELIFNIGYNGSADYSPEMMFSSYTFADGTPFGIKEE